MLGGQWGSAQGDWSAILGGHNQVVSSDYGTAY